MAEKFSFEIAITYSQASEDHFIFWYFSSSVYLKWEKNLNKCQFLPMLLSEVERWRVRAAAPWQYSCDPSKIMYKKSNKKGEE